MSDFLRLPDHLSDLSPPAAGRLEHLRRIVLDYLLAHDYQLHLPALAEHVEVLAAGDENLELDIFKMTDTLSGRTLGIRADHTPQIARFDAATGGAPRRLCYCGPALRTRPPQPWKQREIMQIGGEIFDLPPPAADWEIIRLAVGALRAAGIDDIAIDLGHAGLLHSLLGDSQSAAQRAALCRRLERRDTAMLQEKTATTGHLLRLLNATGESAIAQARAIATEAGIGADMLAPLSFVFQQLRAEGFDVRVDFSEIGGYGYHTGIVFAIYGRDFIAARGGRYDRPGFRPAVGFSMDLREITAHLPPLPPPPPPVACPLATDDKTWFAAIENLYRQNRRLCFAAAASTPSPPVLEKHGDLWQVRET